jgi:indolepyruvate ferredoxin oxidoreductase beta subunit
MKPSVHPLQPNWTKNFHLKILLVGVGGQGILTAARVIGEAALQSDLEVQIGEIHGMSQRSGIVETTVVLGDFHSPLIDEREADLIIGFEPLEALRALPRAAPHATVILNTRPILPYSVESGQAHYPEICEIEAHIQSQVQSLISLDAETLACESGSAIAQNMVLLGVACASHRIPIPPEIFRPALSQVDPRHAELNLRAFEKGYRLRIFLSV